MQSLFPYSAKVKTTGPGFGDFCSVRRISAFLICLFLSGCVGVPEGINPVDRFEIEKYMGTWYEIARLDHSFERGLDRITAEYALGEDGGIKVVNRGFSSKKNKWKEAEGRAYFVRGPDEGYLKVSFFGPFYGSYVVFGLDQENYQYAYVTSHKKSYLWLLSRSPDAGRELIEPFVKKAEELGFNTKDLIFVKHEAGEAPKKR